MQWNITQATADQFPLLQYWIGDSDSFHYTYPQAYQDAIRAGGNYGELYEKFYEPLWPRQPINQIYNRQQTGSGLLYAHPFGNTGHGRDGLPLGAKLQSLLDQGHLRCGIRTDQPGLAWLEPNQTDTVYSGMDADYCRALSAGLFAGDAESVVFIPVLDEETGAQLLARNDIDVLAGASWTLKNGLRFSLSQPYFYGHGSDFAESACLMTRNEDYEWSAIVYWIIMATIFAAENGVSLESLHILPEVELLGPGFQRILRDPVYAMGTVDDIYERNMQPILGRQAPNILNGDTSWGPQHHPMHGYF